MSDDDDEIARARRLMRGSPHLNTEQAAAYLGISVWRMKAMRKAGTGPCYRYHSRYIRYLVDDLILWSRLQSPVVTDPDRKRENREKVDG
ncbi:DNA-binding protein [Sphingopyxis sp.]|uniref:helix-turn-helix domain-containing protein n=1 Tax=Sphingopyxis sp. TaxID=1908224 RepID=UPI0025F0A638|nr:DNA-binding protein [Sphingopyxis sp.]